jgi:hypothetical protein
MTNLERNDFVGDEPISIPELEVSISPSSGQEKTTPTFGYKWRTN